MKPDGGVRNLYQYRPFGDWVIFEGPWIHHTFTGEDLFGSGLVALGPRYYDPELGRFLQPDPIVPNPADPQSLNPYSYVLNNPLNLVDPTGLQSERPPPRVTIEGPSIWEQTWDIWYYLSTPSYESPPVDPNPAPGEIPTPGDVVRTVDPLEEAVADWIYDQVWGDWDVVGDPVSPEAKRAVAGALAAIVVKTVGRLVHGFFVPEEPVEQTDPGVDPDGVVYKRTDPRTGDEYVGRSKSPERFNARQGEHDRARGVPHEYEILDRGTPGRDLDVREEDMIRRHGGLRREGGKLVNERHEMSEERYRSSGGAVDDPNK